MSSNSENNTFDILKSDRRIEVDDFIKLDAYQTIEELRDKNSNLKKQMEVMKQEMRKIKSEGEMNEDSKESDDLAKESDDLEEESDDLEEMNDTVDEIRKDELDIYKNESICLKHVIKSLIDRYKREEEYLHIKIATYVEKVRTTNSMLRHAVNELDQYKIAHKDQQVKTMACFKYLGELKTNYETSIEKRDTLNSLLSKQLKELSEQLRKGSNQRESSSTFQEQIIKSPEDWGLQEKIEYLELKFINDRRDKLLERLSFENEQLRKMVENNFYQSADNHCKKRVKTNMDSYLKYINRAPSIAGDMSVHNLTS